MALIRSPLRAFLSPRLAVGRLALFFFSLSICCGPLPAPPARPLPPATASAPPPGCLAGAAAPEVFSIIVEDREVGREVRSRRVEPGPFGPEEVRLSHAVTRMRLGSALIEHTTVRAERVSIETGMLLHGSLVRQDQVSALIHLVGWDGDRWARLVEQRGSVLDPIAADPSPIDLKGVEVVGLALEDHLARLAANGSPPAPSRPVLFYEPGLPAPIPLRFSGPSPGHTEVDGQRIDGVVFEAFRADDDQLVMTALFDDQGQLWEERFLSLGEIRRRFPGPVSWSSETSELLVGLRSPAYLGMPDSAERAVFSLSLPPERIAALDPLGEPSNQTLTRVGDHELRLEVTAGAPDGSFPPRPEDLAPGRYIRPDAPSIRAALRYLRTAGRKGSLPPVRADNATPVIARSSLISDPAAFWRDPAQVAGLVMNYVSAVLPDKRHTFSMADAPTALEHGAGDCTEHAVLFASLMRAHGIPTRLVAGLYLTRGGLWGYHLWNEYWDGGRWRSIDPGNMVYRPGALYVAFSRGASRFEDLRSDLSVFIENTFRGVSFELTEAFGRGGELMILSRPRGEGAGLPETALFNALVLAGRGDHAAALAVLETVIDGNVGSIRLALTRIQLLVAAGRHDLALAEIAVLRRKTSASENLYLLDVLELEALLAVERGPEAEPVLERISVHLAADPTRLALIRARFLCGTGAEVEALDLLRDAIGAAPNDASLRVAFATTTAGLEAEPGEALLQEALDHGREALLLTLSSEPSAFVAMSTLLFRAAHLEEAAVLVEHGLILAPANRDLLELRDRLRSDRCSE